ncbi:MAG: aminotransferase class V-fold PLP-dependent enzyme [Acutalibacteraceae bacterium]|nr:aminotransferase class V-fold PLP-dependent enzyme [Acutalibacteraceae bacterium]
MIYFDNAATSFPKPQSVINSVKNALENYSANPGRSGHSASVKTAEKIYGVREKTANFFGYDKPENVVFTTNCTQAVNFVLKGILDKGDHILISNLEHNAVARPVNKLKSQGVEVTVFDAFAQDIERELDSLVTPKTKMVFCLHASNVCGKVLPIEKIGDFCKKRGILFGVDAAQSGGVLPIDMKKFSIDFLCVASHKGLFAPMGTGILIADYPLKQTILEGGTGSNSISLEQGNDMPEMLESGTVNVPGILGISAGIDFVKKRGIDNIRKHENALCDRLFSRLYGHKKIRLIASREKIRVPVVSFVVQGVDSNAVAEFLNNKNIAVRAGLHCSPMAHKTLGTLDTGTVRFSPGITSDERQVDYLCRVLFDAFR